MRIKLLLSIIISLHLSCVSEKSLHNYPLLTLNNPVHQRLFTGEKHSYRIELLSGQCARLLLDQEGLDTNLTLYTPSNLIITGINLRQEGPTPLTFIADIPGSYRLEIRSSERDQVSGSYTLKIEEIRQSVPKDIHRITAEGAFAEGERLLKYGNEEAKRKALSKFEEALSSWSIVDDRKEQANALKNIGVVHRLLGDLQTAVKKFEQAVRITREILDQRLEGEILNDLGYTSLILGDKQEAWENCNQALKLSQIVNNRSGEAQAINNIGEYYYFSGDLQKALELYKRALTIWVEIGDRRGQAQSLTYSGYTYSDLGDPQKASDSFKQSLSLWQSVNDKRGQGLTLTAIGRLYTRLGESQQAIDYFKQAMQLIQSSNDQLELARTLNGIGFVYETLGEHQKALDHYAQALDLFRTVKYRNGEASTHHEMGRVYFSIRDTEKALEHFRQLLSISQSLRNKRLMSYALRGMGMTYDSKGNKAEALKYYAESLPIYRSGRDRRGEADTLNLIGQIYYGQGMLQNASVRFNRALALFQAAADQIGECITLHKLARVERDRGNLERATSQIEASIKKIEALRTRVNSRELKTLYSASIQQNYELYVDLLMLHEQRGKSSNYAVVAIEASERARARVLLELLTEANADIRRGADPTLTAQASALQQQINVKAERKAQLLNKDPSLPEITTISKEIDILIAKLDEIESQIRVITPSYAALKYPQPLTLKDIQQLLDDRTLLLEYSLGSDRSYVWAITQNSFNHYEIPKRAAIEQAARKLYGLLSISQPDEGQEKKQLEEKYSQSARELSNMILAPVFNQLEEKRLLIVADGVLQYIPFGSLPEPNIRKAGDERKRRQGDKETRRQSLVSPSPCPPVSSSPCAQVPLIVNHEIVNLPSASTLAALRRETAQRAHPPKTIAVFADPVFQKDDMRLKGKTVSTAQQELVQVDSPSNQRSSSMFDDLGRTRIGRDYRRLHWTDLEANAIVDVTDPNQCLVWKGFDANRTNAISPELGKFRIIHFATHGDLDTENPELSAIVLSFFNPQGQKQDAYLRLHDIYNLNLPADLVVLSACETALGKEIKGEGLIGLTRGFMYAGAARVMASLWKVEDKSTAELMKYFYMNLLQKGMSPAAALRQAQIDVWKQREWRLPYHWAGFVLQGEYR